MTIKVAISGFGRIGRLVYRAFLESGRTDMEFVAINDLTDAKMNAHLLKYDSIHGTFKGDIKVEGDYIIAGDHKIRVLSEKDPTKLPWKEMGVDIVMECTGIFTAKDKAMVHINAGAKRVLVSAPSDGADLTVVYGVNHGKLTADHVVVSNASCTTNCLAPVAYVLQKEFGIKHGYMTTIHAYTNDQRILDQAHSDPYRARAAAISMIPSKTGAAKAIGLVLPELAGKLDGGAIRVPTPNVSFVDFNVVLEKTVTKDEVNAAMKKYADGELKGILAYNDVPLVSIDFVGDSHTAIFNAADTKAMPEGSLRVTAWYDNEWGFSVRMLDTAAAMGKFL